MEFPFLRKHVVSGDKCGDAGLLELSASEIAEVVGGDKFIKRAPRNLVRQTLRQQLSFSRVLSPNTKEFRTAKCTTMKNFLMKLWKRLCRTICHPKNENA